MKTYRFLTTRTAVLITLVVFLSIFIFDYFLNLNSYHSIYQNILIVISIFASLLLIMITIGLYYGVKLKDNIGKLTEHIDLKKFPDMNGASLPDMGSFGGDGIAGVLLAILSAIILILFAYIFVLTSWYLLVFFAGMLYWVYFRALRLVFKNSSQCKNDIKSSLKLGFIYSSLYTSWMFAIILSIHFLKL